MTAVKLLVLPTAIREISEQAAFYQERSGTALAQRWRASVNNAIRSLRSFPERGSPTNFDSLSLHNVRTLHIEGFPKHLVFYRFDASTSSLLIISVLHGARDLEAVLKFDIRS